MNKIDKSDVICYNKNNNRQIEKQIIQQVNNNAKTFQQVASEFAILNKGV